MADKLTDRPGGGPRLYGRRYPWDRWFRRRAFTLRQGDDYNGRTYTMAQQVRNAAGRLRRKVSIAVADDGRSLTVTVLKGEG